MHKYFKFISGTTLFLLVTGIFLAGQATPIDPAKEPAGKTQGAAEKKGATDEARSKSLKSAQPIRSMKDGISSKQIKYDERLGKVIERFEKGNSYLETLETGLAEKREEAGQARTLSTNENIRAELKALHGTAAEESTAYRLLDLMKLITTNSSAVGKIAWSMYGNPPVAGAPNFLGPLGSESLNLGVKGKKAFRIIPTAFTPNLIGGNEANVTSREVVGAVIAGGGDTFFPNQVHGDYGTVGGGLNNVAGGEFRYLKSPFATVSGGRNNSANRRYSSVGGGMRNTANGLSSVVSGGEENTASDEFGTVGGGSKNTAKGRYASVGGGRNNQATGTSSTLAGGEQNQASGRNAFVGGGTNNEAAGDNSALPGGSFNTALGKHSFAAGYHAQARHEGSFVWSDSSKKTFQSTGKDQFLIKAGGNVGIDTENPAEKLTVAGNIAPANASAHSLGTKTKPWKSIYLDDAIHVAKEWRVEQKGRTALRLDKDGNLHVGGKIISSGRTVVEKATDLGTIDPNAAIKRGTPPQPRKQPSPGTQQPSVPGQDTLTRSTAFSGSVQGSYDALEIAPKSITPFHLANQAVNSDAIANGSIGLQDINRSEFEGAYVTRTGGKITGTVYLPEDGLAVGVNQLHVRDGKVGIGVSEPKEKLSVKGAIFASEGIRFADGTLQKTAHSTPGPEMSEAFIDLVKDTVEKEFMPLVEKRLAAQPTRGAIAQATGVQPDPTTSLTKKELQAVMQTFRTELQQALAAQAQSLKPTERTLTVDEERALIRKAVSEMKQTMERMVSTLKPPPATEDHGTLSRKEIDIITGEFISTIDQRIKEYHPNQVVNQYVTNVTQVLKQTITDKERASLLQDLQAKLTANLAVPKPQTVTNLVETPLAPEKIQALRNELMNDLSKAMKAEIKTLEAQRKAGTPTPAQELSAELRKNLLQQLDRQISQSVAKQVQDFKVQQNKASKVTQGSLSNKERTQLMAQIRKDMDQKLAMSKSSSVTKVIREEITQDEKIELVEDILKQTDERIVERVRKVTVTNTIVQTLPEEERQAIKKTLRNELEEVLEALVKPPVVQQTVITNTVVKDLSQEKQQLLLAAARADMQKLIAEIKIPEPVVKHTSVTNTIVKEISKAKQAELLQAARADMQKLIAEIKTPEPVVKHTSVTNIIERELTDLQKTVILNDLYDRAAGEIKAMVKPPVITENYTTNIIRETNIIEREITDAQKTDMLNDLYDRAAGEIKAMVKPPVVTENYTTNIIRETQIIEREMTDAQKTDMLNDLYDRAAGEIKAMVKPPVVTENYTTNIIEREITDAQKTDMLNDLYDRAAGELKAMVKPPVVTENYTTNIIEREITDAQKTDMLNDLYDRAAGELKAMVKPPVVTENYTTNIIRETNIIERELSDAQKTDMLNDLYDRAAGELKAMIKPPVVTENYTTNIIRETNIIEREITDAQKTDMLNDLYDRAAGELKAMVKPPLVTENYITNIIRETISPAERESILRAAQQGILASLPKPKAPETRTAGINNMVARPSASVAGGQENVAAGEYSSIPGGRDNLAKGPYSLAAGRRAKALHEGSLVWADSNDQDFLSKTRNEFSVRASGGTRIQSGLSAQSGVSLHPGSHAWSVQASAAAKKNVARADVTDVLDRLSKLPIYSFRLNDQASGAVHLGPHAEEFYAAFGLGENAASMNSADANAVSLAAVQALHQLFMEKLIEAERNKLEIQRMRTEIDEMNAFIKQLRQVLEAQATATP